MRLQRRDCRCAIKRRSGDAVDHADRCRRASYLRLRTRLADALV
jgi:hypothetical protein